MTKETQLDFGLIAQDPAVAAGIARLAQEAEIEARELETSENEARPLYAPLGWANGITLVESNKPAAGLPTDPKARKQTPLYSGFFKYFPRAIAATARLSFIGNEQHHPGQPLHWAKGKSTDHEDCLLRHLMDRTLGVPTDSDGVDHLIKVFWRAGALLETAIENGEVTIP